MKVKELMDFLKEQPEDMEVVVSGYIFKTTCDLKTIEGRYIHLVEQIKDVYYSWSDKVVLRILD
jgi:hypothetical protein